MRRFTRQAILVLGIMLLIGTAGGSTWADDAPAATPDRAEHAPRRHHARAATESETARLEREHRQDLERRVERLEQLEGLKDANTSPPEPAR